MRLVSIASGSSGNCIYVGNDNTHLLVDVGISAKRIEAGLKEIDLCGKDLDGILITHEHSDHISGLATLFKKHHLPVYCSRGTGRQLAYRIAFLDEVLHTFDPGEQFALGELQVASFATLHDAADPVGYTFTADCRKAAIVTDLGVVTPVVADAVQGTDLLVAEANHDPAMLMDGPYPYYLKQRILGHHGHLSNAACGELCRGAGAKTVVLAHLSAENNRPSLALEAVRAAVGSAVEVEVAPRCEAGRRYQV